MTTKEYWEHTYHGKAIESLSWFQAHAERSLRLIRETGIPLTASIIDVGGGASMLVDDLLQAGYENLTVLDVSETALFAAKARLGPRSKIVKWWEADITDAKLPVGAYDLWHDRAVFHFLTSQRDRRAYVREVVRAVKPGGHVIVAAFSESGPTQCSGLPVMRYSPEALHAEFGAAFTLLRHEEEEHRTPSGRSQQFIYCYCQAKHPPMNKPSAKHNV